MWQTTPQGDIPQSAAIMIIFAVESLPLVRRWSAFCSFYGG
jgi:hypothetical protein